MKITQIVSTSAWDKTYMCVHERIYGLGEDNKIYRWNTIINDWCLFTDEESNALYKEIVDKNTNSIA